MGKAILHIHSTFSDGVATVEQILEEVERNSDIDLVGFTDHDNVHAYQRASHWVEAHPDCRVRPIWGIELTIWAFKHLLVYCFEPPFRAQPFPKFMPLATAVREIKAAGGTIIVPHVDTFWIGMGRHRLARVAHELGIDGLELLNPYLASPRSIRNLERKNGEMGILAVGGSDAHHLEDLYKVIVDFPGHTVEDLKVAFKDRTAIPRWGRAGGKVPIANLMRQHTRALLFHPAEQLHAWARRPRFAKRQVDPEAGAVHTHQ